MPIYKEYITPELLEIKISGGGKIMQASVEGSTISNYNLHDLPEE